MKVLIVMLLLHLAVAANKQRQDSGRPILFIESFNKNYFKYYKLSFNFTNRTHYNIKAEFFLLKTLNLEKLWLDINFYHKRSNQYHLIPIGRGIKLQTFLEENHFGLGDSINKCCPFPMPPGNHTIIVPKSYVSGSKIFPVPMVGEYKMVVVQKDSTVPTVTYQVIASVTDETVNKG